MTAAAVKEGCHVQTYIIMAEGIVHDDIVGGKNFVYIVQGDAFWQGSGSAGAESENFIVNVGTKVSFRFRICFIGNVIFVEYMMFRQVTALDIVCKYKTFRLPGSHAFCLNHCVADVGGVDYDFWLIVVNEQGHFSRRQITVCRKQNAADFAGRNIAGAEDRGIPQNCHDDIVFFYAVFFEGMGKPVCLCIQFPVGPLPFLVGIDDGWSLGKAADIAHETVQPCVFMLKSIYKHSVVISSCHTLSA